MNERQLISLAHVVDAAWIEALWIAIHGGDPPPQQQQIGENVSTDLIAGALVARLAEQYPEAYQTPGASLAKLAKLGISMTATLADKREFNLHGPEDLKRFAEALFTTRAGEEGPFHRICINTQYFGIVCKTLYKVT